MSSAKSLPDTLSGILAEKTCVVGLGNPYRSDDGVGVVIAERLKTAALPKGIEVLNAEDVLESYVFPLAEKDVRNVLLVDAMRCGDAAPGTLVLGRLGELEELVGGISTHKLSLAISGRILEERGKAVYLLGIAAGNVDFGTRMADEVSASAEAVIEMICAKERENGNGNL